MCEFLKSIDHASIQLAGRQSDDTNNNSNHPFSFPRTGTLFFFFALQTAASRGGPKLGAGQLGQRAGEVLPGARLRQVPRVSEGAGRHEAQPQPGRVGRRQGGHACE